MVEIGSYAKNGFNSREEQMVKKFSFKDQIQLLSEMFACPSPFLISSFSTSDRLEFGVSYILLMAMLELEFGRLHYDARAGFADSAALAGFGTMGCAITLDD